MRLDIDKDHAYAWSRTRKGGSCIAQLRSTSRKPKSDTLLKTAFYDLKTAFLSNSFFKDYNLKPQINLA
jgi:hypothetical protein